MEIKLDTEALNSLFPEGTEARLKLQQAVIQNFVNRNFIKFGNEELQKLVRDELVKAKLPDLKAYTQSLVEKEFSRRGWNGVEASPSVNFRIESEVTRIANERFSNFITERCEDALSKTHHIPEYTINKLIKEADTNLEKMVENRLRLKFGEILDNAIKAKLGFK